MSDAKEPVDFDKVRSDELDEIAKRRREANIAVGKGQNGRHHSPSEDLVGLALSGGGVRSASFNLGLLQSLYQRGVLRHVDYMSTVSGGGYVGSSLSSLALHPDTEFDWKSDGHQGVEESPAAGAQADTSSIDRSTTSKEHASLSPRDDGRQPPRVLELIHGGDYLRRPLIFLNRYLVGVLLTNIVALSFVFALAALAAWLFRSLDHTWSINWLFALGFQGDIARAFFPATVFFALWLVMWGISYWRDGSQAEGRVARWFLSLTIVSVLLACAALLGTGDVSLTHLRDTYGIQPPSELVERLGGELKFYFIIALLIALIPYLRIKDLLRSGTRPRTAVEGWIFAIASRALLYGIPLLIFGWLAQENISHFNENRVKKLAGQTIDTQSDFVPLDFRDWADTWGVIQLQDTEVSDPANKDRYAVSRKMWEAAGTHVDSDGVKQINHDDVLLSRKLVEEMAAFDRERSMFRRWLFYFGYLMTWQDNEVKDYFETREKYLELRRTICDRLTRQLLADPDFYQEFEKASDHLAVQLAGMPTKEQDQRVNRIKTLIIEAKYLKTRAEKLVMPGDDPESKALTFDTWRDARDKAVDILRDPNRTAQQIAESKKDLEYLMKDGEFARTESEVKALNWQLLENYWGDRLNPKSTVFAMVCLEADQRTRMNWFLWSLVAFLVSACVVNLNATSLHGFYRNMLSKMWITECPGLGRRIPLARLETVARGAPYHLITATVHMLGRRDRTDLSRTDTFIFSQSYCGSDRTGYLPTERYMNGRFDLANAMALSGAAVSPTQVNNPLLAVLLMLSNSRLGQWLPNPGHRLIVFKWLDRLVSWFPPVPLRLIIGAVQKAEQRNYCFVSDGGHHENLGVESLLLRRCRVIIASDATGDPEYEFRSFVRLLRRMRFEHGIRIVGMDGRNSGVPLDVLTPENLKGDQQQAHGDTELPEISNSELAQSHYFLARILYPSDGPKGSPREGYLVYIKPNFTGDEAVDLRRYKLEDPAFPHDPTTDQFYDPQKFESYRQLGFHIGNTVCHQQFSDFQSHHASSPALCHWSPGDAQSQQSGHAAGKSRYPEMATALSNLKSTENSEGGRYGEPVSYEI